MRLQVHQRAQIVREVLGGHRTVTQVAREDNISRKAIYKWLNNYKNLDYAGI